MSDKTPFKPCKIFVYGTLKRSHGNYYRLELNRQVFVGEATTVEKFPMASNGSFPLAFNVPGTGKQVQGEIFEIQTSEQLERMDRLEGHPRWYQRTAIKVTDKTGAVHDVEMYLQPKAEFDRKPIEEKYLLEKFEAGSPAYPQAY